MKQATLKTLALLGTMLIAAAAVPADAFAGNRNHGGYERYSGQDSGYQQRASRKQYPGDGYGHRGGYGHTRHGKGHGYGHYSHGKGHGYGHNKPYYYPRYRYPYPQYDYGHRHYGYYPSPYYPYYSPYRMGYGYGYGFYGYK